MSDKPAHTIRIGAIKATIWKNQPEVGKSFFATTFTRNYRDNDEWKESSSFFPDDLPKLELAARKAFEFIQLIPTEPSVESQSHQEKVSRQRQAKSR